MMLYYFSRLELKWLLSRAVVEETLSNR